jgi:hypothetical protein
MTIEFWLLLGAIALLAVATVIRGVALFKGQGWWDPVAVGARLGASVVLVVVLILSISVQGGWSPFDLRQVVLGLALATVCVHLGLLWRGGVDGAGPVVDLLVLILLLLEAFVIRPVASVLACPEPMTAVYVQWSLFLLGIGSAVVAGSASLLLVLRGLGVVRRLDLQLPTGADLYVFLRWATALALVAVGGGLAVSAWWAWRSVGSLTSGDPREVWMASVWLVIGMSLLSWELERRPGRWAAALALVAATAGIFFLVALDLQLLAV